MKSKYRAKKTFVDGIRFDSVREARRYKELKLLERAGEIKELRMQVKYVLIPAQYETYKRYGKHGTRLKDGKRIAERECCYIADFCYWDVKKCEEVVEDAKGVRTKDYIVKRKLMRYVHGIKINEV